MESSGRVIVCKSESGSSYTCLSEVLVGAGGLRSELLLPHLAAKFNSLRRETDGGALQNDRNSHQVTPRSLLLTVSQHCKKEHIKETVFNVSGEI